MAGGEQAGERTEAPTPRRLEEAIKKGQIPRSAEVQTVFVFMSAILAFMFYGMETWRVLISTMANVLAHLHDVQVTFNLLPRYAIGGGIVIAQCVGPIVVAIMIGALLAGCIQNRFQTAPEALEPKWDRLNPMQGLQRIFSFQSAAPTGLAILKLGVVGGLTYTTVTSILRDPIFYQTADVARIADFLASSTMKILLRITLIMLVIASLDYAYQFWNYNKNMMMTKEEIKEEQKSSEVNAMVKAAQGKRRRLSMRKMLAEVPKADVVITNPTHFAIALKYDPKTMKAPKILAKGTRLHALQIREIATKHQIPIVENKPLARMMFKYGKVNGEIPAQLYLAVAEILAWVYKTNRYKYYVQGNQAA